MVWPIFFRRFIDDGFCITKGSKSDVEYYGLEHFVKSIKIEKFKYGSKVEYMNLVIIKETYFIKKNISTTKSFRKNKISMLTSHKKSNHKNTPSKTLW